MVSCADTRKEKPLRTLGIAGGWGYIGQRFFDAGRRLGLDLYVLDPSHPPQDLDLQGVTVVESAEDFYGLPLDLYHLALHPQHRRPALARLAERPRRGEEVAVLCEKPVALPEKSEECHEAVRLARIPGLKIFYDFPELFDPQTRLIHRYLGQFREVRIREIWLERGKDREETANPRNYKIMVPIQYQETVHCLAFALDLLARFHGEAVLQLHGVTFRGESQPYVPPNPECYAYVVDGKCLGEFGIDGVRVHIETDFKKGAPFRKRRRIAGEADGAPFTIEADLLEGRKYLRINGEDQHVPPDSNSYAAVLRQLWEWNCTLSQGQLNSGLFPNVRLACTGFLLSAALWQACHLRTEVKVDSIGQAFEIAAVAAAQYGSGPVSRWRVAQ